MRPNLREWHASGVATYNFREGVLRGLRLTGAFRWESGATIGYYSKRLDSGDEAFDLSKPVLTQPNLYVDAAVGYSLRVPKKWGGNRVTLAINVRNVLDREKPIGIQSLTNGEFGVLTYQQPRLVQFSTDVQF